MSATPRTDAALGQGGGSNYNAVVMRCERVLACCRELERELSEAQLVLNMLALDGNCSDPSLRGAAKLRQLIDDLIVARRGWAIRHVDGRWRTLDASGMAGWTDDLAKALVCRLREHVDGFAGDDPEDVRIVEVVWGMP
jgi:hypothetical protein